MRRQKKFPFLPLVALVGAAGCDTDPGAATINRDAYTRMEDCIADWGNAALCKTEVANVNNNQSSTGGTHSGGGAFIFIHGPGYYGSERVVTTPGGQTIRPTSVAAPVAVNSFTKAGAFVGNFPAKSGGFGAMGARAGGSSSS